MSAVGGCECGGSSAVATKGSCTCGSGGDASMMTGEGFVRPRFFGGMLLTEDDLQAAIDYTVAKRRLTNRHVLGAGVVCGLDVACDPCEPGKVKVSPGYAIECCGNDILVSCEEEVDIIALVRELRRRKGVDCGEPCADQPHQDYHLVIRYAEAPTAPVAPYAADDCATGECEFSRIREGYRFELRCEAPDDALTVIDALKACQPKDDVLQEETRTMTRVVALAAKYAEPTGSTAAGTEPGPLAAEQPDPSGVEPGDRAVTAQEPPASASEDERAYITGAEQMRGRILQALAGRGQTACDDYRRVSSLRFERLTASSKDDAVALAQAFLRTIAACTCSAFNPPCPTCSDDAVALAKVRVDGCEVIDVCALERSWVLSPRALGYWVPLVDMFRQCLEQACCEPPGSSRQPVDPIHCMGTSLEQAWKTFDGAFAGASGTSPDFRELLQAMGRPVVPETAVAAPASAEPGVGALEAKIAELGKRIDELSAGQKTEEQR